MKQYKQQKQSALWQVRSAGGVLAAWLACGGLVVCASLTMAAPERVAAAEGVHLTAPRQGNHMGVQQLQRFLRSTQQGWARFTQTVSMQREAERPAELPTEAAVVGAPVRSGAGGQLQQNTVRRSSGSLSFLRPMRLRMLYQQPYRQEIVVDGKKMWFYDADLEQVSVRSQSSVVVAETPLAALLTAQTVDELRNDFVIEEGRDGGQPKNKQAESVQAEQLVAWVTLIPKRADGQLRRLVLAFDGDSGEYAKAPRLRVLESYDGFGQVSVMRLDYAADNQREGGERNLTPADFAFTPPQGVAVYEQPSPIE